MNFKADGTEVSYAPPSPLPPLFFDEARKRTPTPEIGVRDVEAPKPWEKRASLKPGPQAAVRKVTAVKGKGGKGKGRGNPRTKGKGQRKKQKGRGQGQDRMSREGVSSGGGDSQWEES